MEDHKMYKCNNCKHEDLQARANKFCLKCGDNVVEIKDKDGVVIWRRGDPVE